MLDIQAEMLNGMKSMEPLLAKAEGLVEKYETFMSKIQTNA